MAMPLLIGLDIGGTKTLAWSWSAATGLACGPRHATPEAPADGLALLVRLARDLAADRPIAGIGVSIGGPIDAAAGTVSPLHQPAWRGLALGSRLRADLAAPVAIEVDTDAAALAEWRWGGAAGDPLLYLTISTGIGGGLVEGGRLRRGAGGCHPEVGHVPVPTGQPPVACACGGEDCLEALLGGRALARRHGRPADRLADAAWAQAGTRLGCGLAAIATCLAPQHIVIGGGVALGAGERLLEPARRELARRLRLVPVPDLRLAGLGYASAAAGALLLAAQAAGTPPPDLDARTIHALIPGQDGR